MLPIPLPASPVAPRGNVTASGEGLPFQMAVMVDDGQLRILLNEAYILATKDFAQAPAVALIKAGHRNGLFHTSSPRVMFVWCHMGVRAYGLINGLGRPNMGGVSMADRVAPWEAALTRWNTERILVLLRGPLRSHPRPPILSLITNCPNTDTSCHIFLSSYPTQ